MSTVAGQLQIPLGVASRSDGAGTTSDSAAVLDASSTGSFLELLLGAALASSEANEGELLAPPNDPSESDSTASGANEAFAPLALPVLQGESVDPDAIEAEPATAGDETEAWLEFGPEGEIEPPHGSPAAAALAVAPSAVAEPLVPASSPEPQIAPGAPSASTAPDPDSADRIAASTQEQDTAPSARRVLAEPSTEARAFERTSASDAPFTRRFASDTSTDSGNEDGRTSAFEPAIAESTPASASELEWMTEPGDRTSSSLASSLQSANEASARAADPSQLALGRASRDPAATPREARALPELPAANEHEIIRRAQVLAREGGGQARIELRPPQLGHLGLRITVTDQNVHVRLLADRAPVADLLARHLPELRQTLEAQGLTIDSLDVDARSGSDLPDSAFQDHGGAHRGDPMGGSRSRGSNGTDHDLIPLITHRSLQSLGAIDVRV
jgi:hypothetical protein